MSVDGGCFQEKALQSSSSWFYFVPTSWQLFSQEASSRKRFLFGP